MLAPGLPWDEPSESLPHRCSCSAPGSSGSASGRGSRAERGSWAGLWPRRTLPPVSLFEINSVSSSLTHTSSSQGCVLHPLTHLTRYGDFGGHETFLKNSTQVGTCPLYFFPTAQRRRLLATAAPRAVVAVATARFPPPPGCRFSTEISGHRSAGPVLCGDRHHRPVLSLPAWPHLALPPEQPGGLCFASAPRCGCAYLPSPRCAGSGARGAVYNIFTFLKLFPSSTEASQIVLRVFPGKGRRRIRESVPSLASLAKPVTPSHTVTPPPDPTPGPAAPTMELPSVCGHPGWFLLSLLLGLLLWARRRRPWDPRKCPTDLSGKTVIVTGANSGEWWLVAQGASVGLGGVGMRGWWVPSDVPSATLTYRCHAVCSRDGPCRAAPAGTFCPGAPNLARCWVPGSASTPGLCPRTLPQPGEWLTAKATALGAGRRLGVPSHAGHWGVPCMPGDRVAPCAASHPGGTCPTAPYCHPTLSWVLPALRGTGSPSTALPGS